MKEDEVRAVLRAAFDVLGPVDVEPPLLQSAALYLELAGEALRARAFTVVTSAGEELALRPEMTAPAVRAALDLDLWRGGGFSVRYDGVVIRRMAPGEGREFRQVGVESFSRDMSPAADAKVLRLAIEACHACGLAPRLTLGHTGIYRALLAALPFPPLWRARLEGAFASPAGLGPLLAEAETEASENGTAALQDAIAGLTDEAAAGVVEQMLAAQRINVLAGRGPADIARRLRERAQARSAERPPANAIKALREALAIAAAPSRALEALRGLVKRAGGEVKTLEPAFGALEATLGALGGSLPAEVRFGPGFGRGLAYYDGLVFELEVGPADQPIALGGGGRYDGLLRELARRHASGRADAAEKWGAAGFALRPARIAKALEQAQ